MKKPSRRMYMPWSSTHPTKTSKSAASNNPAHKKDPFRWAGFFKDDPFFEEMAAFIKAERAELDALQE